jgi:hypothetical protein
MTSYNSDSTLWKTRETGSEPEPSGGETEKFNLAQRRAPYRNGAILFPGLLSPNSLCIWIRHPGGAFSR